MGDTDGICSGGVPPLVNGRLTGSNLTLAAAALALERGEDLELTDVQRRMVEEHALKEPPV